MSMPQQPVTRKANIGTVSQQTTAAIDVFARGPPPPGSATTITSIGSDGSNNIASQAVTYGIHHPLHQQQQTQQQQQQTQQQQSSMSSHPIGPPTYNGVDMELPQRIGTTQPSVQYQQQQQFPLPPTSSAIPSPTLTTLPVPSHGNTTVTSTNTVASVTMSTTVPNNNFNNNLSSSILSTPSSTFRMDMNKSLDQLADDFLIGPKTYEKLYNNNNSSSKMMPKAIVLVPDAIPNNINDYERLQILVKKRAYMDVLLYTRILLEGSNSHYTFLFDAMKSINNTNNTTNNNSKNVIEMALDTHKQDLVNILIIHITAMVKLNLVQELLVEMDQWTFCYHHHDRMKKIENNSFDFNDNSTNNNNDNRNNTNPLLNWIPWKFHILAASTLQYRTSSSTNTSNMKQECIDALWNIRDAIPDTDIQSRINVENTLSNIFITIKNYRMALECIQRIIDISPLIVREEANHVATIQKQSNKNTVPILDAVQSYEHVLLVIYRIECLSRQGRLLLQLGALDAACIIFDQVRTLYKDLTLNDTFKVQENIVAIQYNIIIQVIVAQLSSNDGLLQFSRGKYEEALELFNTCIQKLRSINTEIDLCNKEKKQQHSNNSETLLLFESIRNNMYNETLNNMSLCALYTCRIHNAIQLMESLIRENVTLYLTERITLNVCTMYELAMDTNTALQKKNVLQTIATRFLIQDIPIECFRMS
jgi:tetratricopeptide (TPR) repeat protein